MCLDLPPLGECAWGQCVAGQCVCDPGVIQNVELLFRPVASNETLICDYNVQGAIGSTIAILVLVAVVFVMQLSALENRNQVKCCTVLSWPFVTRVAVSEATANPNRLRSVADRVKHTTLSTDGSAVGYRLRLYLLHCASYDSVHVADHYLLK